MKNILRTIFPAALLLTFLSGSALAQTKIATVDIRHLWENYWKTKAAQAALQDRTAQLTKDDNVMRDDFKKASEDYQKLLTQANDPAVSTEERDRRKQAAADKLKQLTDRRAAIDDYERTAQAKINEQFQRMNEKIMADINSHVADVAKAGGYTLVLNSADEPINLGAGKITIPSAVVYSDKSVDLTADVLKQLNAGAPIDLTAPSNSAPLTLPAPSLLNTNSP